MTGLPVSPIGHSAPTFKDRHRLCPRHRELHALLRRHIHGEHLGIHLRRTDSTCVPSGFAALSAESRYTACAWSRNDETSAASPAQRRSPRLLQVCRVRAVRSVISQMHAFSVLPVRLTAGGSPPGRFPAFSARCLSVASCTNG